MNYFAQGIQQGGEIGARSYLEKQKRDQDAALNKARLDFEANQLKENFKGQGALLDTRLLADAENARLSREFTGGENALNRTYGTNERLANQRFQGGENNANRALTASQGQATRDVTTSEGTANRAQNEKEAAARVILDAQRLKQGGEQYEQTLAWDKDPTNPQNIYRSAAAKRALSDLPPDLQDGGGMPQFDRSTALPGMRTRITSQKQYEALPPGSRFTYNGQNGTKP